MFSDHYRTEYKQRSCFWGERLFYNLNIHEHYNNNHNNFNYNRNYSYN